MRGRGRPKSPDVLTRREFEVLALLREGLSNRGIADRLGISLAGAKFHLSQIIFSFAQPGGRHDTALMVNNREAIWSSSAPIMHRFDATSDLGLVITLHVGNFASGCDPEGSSFSGSPMTYSLGTDSLDLDTLIRIAESQSFPPMLEPLNGATPAPYFD